MGLDKVDRDSNYPYKLMLWDTDLEKKIKLGVQYPFDALEKGECILHQKL